ncbi:MAG: hypothetical protein ACTSRK_09665 [Promethearchaeota archaeon]
MITKYKRMLIISLGIIILSSFINATVAASGSWDYPDYEYPLEIEDAMYDDLDGDGLEDDVLVEFELISPTDEDCFFKGAFTLSLVLPSGFTHVFTFSIRETFEELEVEVELYNVATENGWYDLHIEADILCRSEGTVFLGIAEDSLTFDPREYQDGFLPYAIVIYKL